jgi:hypothetical protein
MLLLLHTFIEKTRLQPPPCATYVQHITFKTVQLKVAVGQQQIHARTTFNELSITPCKEKVALQPFDLCDEGRKRFKKFT